MRIISVPNFIKKHKIISLIIASITILWVVVLCVWLSTIYAPHPLGDKMEYLGKEDYGNILGFDEAPYSTYYYGTDIPPQEIPEYFSGTTLKRPIENKGSYIDVWLVYKGKRTSVTYTLDTPEGIKKSNKKYVLSVVDEDYKVLHKALDASKKP